MKRIHFIVLFIFFIIVLLNLCFVVLKEENEPLTQKESLQQTELQKTPDIDLTNVFIASAAEQSPNQELQIYTLSQAEIDNTHIKLEANMINDQYISGKVESTIAFRYGTFTFRVNSITGTGLFPAIWLLPIDGKNYPEVDIYEAIGNEPHKIYGVLHYLKDEQKKRDFFKHKFPKKNIPDTYLIRFEWSAEEMVWYLNDEKIYSIQKNVPNQHMYMIMNLAVGGIWPGEPDESTIFPTSFEIEVLEFNPKETYLR